MTISILVLLFSAPFLVLYKRIKAVVDRQGMQIQSIKTPYSVSSSPLIGFAGAYEFEISPKIYFAKFSINNQTFTQVISGEKVSEPEIMIDYVVGKSGKVYIKNLN